jgi:uncharacterized protein (TIGR00297 family)
VILKERLLYGFIITIAFGLISFLFKLVSLSGFIAGVIAGTWIYILTSWKGFLLLVIFFVIASISTKLGYSLKEKLGMHQENKGARGTKHVLANVSLALLIAVAYFLSGEAMIIAAAFAACFATALSDTTSSEIGLLYGKNTFLVTNFKRVRPGTDGAVSIEGTLAGLGGALIISIAVYFTKFVPQIGAALLVGLAGFLGNLGESYLNAIVKQKSAIDNELMNFINTLLGAGLAILLINLFY